MSSGKRWPFCLGLNVLRCKMSTCLLYLCPTCYFPDLRMALSKRLHGQHLVIDPVIKSLGAHLHNPNPAKALVMSFHGWTGNGKNFVSNIISDHLFKLGRNSSFVNLIIATHHFPHASRKEQYQVPWYLKMFFSNCWPFFFTKTATNSLRTSNGKWPTFCRHFQMYFVFLTESVCMSISGIPKSSRPVSYTH